MSQTTLIFMKEGEKYLSPKILELLRTFQTKEELVSAYCNSSVVTRIFEKLSFVFRTPELFFNAFVHSSLVNEATSLALMSNERLEFLGDSILSEIVAVDLYKLFPNENEGTLSKLKSALVSEEMLVDLAYTINLDRLLLMGRGEVKTESFLRPGPLADAFEALLAAAYLDQGQDGARKVFEKTIELYQEYRPLPFYSLDRLLEFDAKTKLQEKTLKEFAVLPEYRSREIENGIFEIELYLLGELKATTRSCSKKKGEKEAAAICLRKY